MGKRTLALANQLILKITHELEGYPEYTKPSYPFAHAAPHLALSQFMAINYTSFTV